MKIEEAIRQKKFDSPYQKAFVNLIYTYNQVMEQQEELFGRFGLTPQQYNVLRILRGKYPNSACVGEVKEVMLDKNPDLTRLCDRLIKKNLMQREINAYNKRQVLIKITKSGMELLKKMDPVIKKSYRNKNGLSPAEAEKLSDLLDKLRN